MQKSQVVLHSEELPLNFLFFFFLIIIISLWSGPLNCVDVQLCEAFSTVAEQGCGLPK